MATRKRIADAKPQSERAINPAAAWPFPTTASRTTADIESTAADHPGPAVADDGDSGGDPDVINCGKCGRRHPVISELCTADRIEVASLRLYTDPTKNTVERIPLEQLVESPFNPRTRYNQKDLQDLAETIKAVGIMQPLLARPIWKNTLQREHGGVSHYELVFGHRRLRGAKLAEAADAPVIVRELSNAQAAQLQAIENVQRKDLDPIEEARGYAHYLKVHGVSKDQLAKEIGLSRSHVYGRLKLATAIPAVLDAVQSGEIYEENALRIARLPEKLQIKALEAVRKDYRYDPDDGGKKSVRRIQDFLREKFTLKLAEALFNTQDAQLLVDAGSCTDCPKRTGNAPEFEDLATDAEKDYGGRTLRAGPDLCTDPDCFDAKKKAHLVNEAEKLQAKGKTVVTGAKARSAIGADGTVKGAYVPLKAVRDQLAKAKKAGTGAAVQTVTIQDPRTGKTVEAVARESLKDLGVKVKEAPKGGGGYDYKAEQAKREEERKKAEERGDRETKINLGVLAAVRQAAAGQQLSTVAMQLIAAAALRGVPYQQRSMLAQLHDCKSVEQLEKKVGQLPPERLTTLLLDCALVENVVTNGYRDEKPQALLAAAKHYGVDIAQVRKEIEAKAADTKTQDLLQPDAAAPNVDHEEEAAEA